jgi:flagellar protein FlgJ
MKIESSKIHPMRSPTTQEQMDLQLREVSKTYEKHFLREMVKAMRSSVHESQLVPKSMGERIYSEQLDDQYVESWGDAGGIGLADLIYNDVKEKIFGDVAPEQELPKVHMPMPIKSDVPPTLRMDEEGFELEAKSETGPSAQRTPVVSPLEGSVVESFENHGRHYVRIDHGERGVSLLSYVGNALPISRGAKVESSQELGWLDESAHSVHWKWLKAKG